MLENNLHPVTAAMRPAARTPASLNPTPSSNSTLCAFKRPAIASTTSSGTRGRAPALIGPCGAKRPSPHAQSAGTISVATLPIGFGLAAIAARTAARPFSASIVDDVAVRIHADTGFATPSMSDVSGAS